MKVAAYLLRSGAVDVRTDEKVPDGYLAVLIVDGGVTDDWTFISKLAEKQMHDRYIVADGRACKVEPHCGHKTFRVQKKRYNVSGEPHECRRKK